MADSDPRFAPVRAGELDRITLEVSVLSPEQEIHTIDDIELGRHGLIVEQGSRRGLLLPQVPAEHDWDRETFVAQTCLKAGLAHRRMAARRADLHLRGRSVRGRRAIGGPWITSVIPSSALRSVKLA